MPRFDVHANPDGGDAAYLLDVQSDLLDGLNTRVVVPLIRRTAYPVAARRLHPAFAVEGEPFVMATHLLASVSTAELGAPVGSLREEHDAIVAALDMLFHGF